ncbi:hypothetical protein COOONC_07198 [Cooperia oncophora]
MSSETVAHHYNTVQQQGLAGRAENESLQLLREESVNKMFRPRVLDLACGKGGDLRKWNIANVDSVVMADVAQVSLNQAKERYDEMAQRERGGLFPVEFVHADCSKVRFNETLTTAFLLSACPLYVTRRSFVIHSSVKCVREIHLKYLVTSSWKLRLSSALESRTLHCKGNVAKQPNRVSCGLFFSSIAARSLFSNVWLKL